MRGLEFIGAGGFVYFLVCLFICLLCLHRSVYFALLCVFVYFDLGVRTVVLFVYFWKKRVLLMGWAGLGVLTAQDFFFEQYLSTYLSCLSGLV